MNRAKRCRAMDVAAALVIVLTQQGYWFGDQANTIHVGWPLAHERGEALLTWELRFGERVVLAHGEVRLRGNGEPVEIEVTPPAVERRVNMVWAWQVHALDGDDGDELLARGTRTIRVFPRTALEHASVDLENRRLLIWDKPDGLPALLEAAGVAHQHVESATALSTRDADLILVGTDQLDAAGHARLRNLAANGTSVMIFAQRRLERIGDYELLARPVPDALQVRKDHALLRSFRVDDLAHWLDDEDVRPRAARRVHALELPADAPVRALVQWPTYAREHEAHPRQALLAEKKQGRGRLIFCQMPLGDWHRDPRSQLLLANALDHMRTAPDPTPPPGRWIDSTRLIIIERATGFVPVSSND